MDAKSVGFYKRNWWMFLVEGIVAVLFGLFAVVNPANTLALVVLYFGLFLIVSGIVNMVMGALSVGRTSVGWLAIILGFLEMGLGVYLARRPGLTFSLFVLYAVLALFVRGVFSLVEAFGAGLTGGARALRAIGGAAGILAGIVIWNYPVKGGLAFVWVLGLYALIVGPLLIVLAFEAKEGFKNN